jgi:hypothetical protein
MLAFVILDAIVALIPLRLPANVTPADRVPGRQKPLTSDNVGYQTQARHLDKPPHTPQDLNHRAQGARGGTMPGSRTGWLNVMYES